MTPAKLRGQLKHAWLTALPSLLLCLAFDFVGGTFLGKYFEKLMVSYPVLLVVLPGLMGLRGNIFGALSSRFTTALYLGELKPSLRERKVVENVYLSLTLTFTPILILWMIGSIKTMNLYESVVALLILITSPTIVGVILGYATAAVTIIPFRNGIDPDLIAAPLITSIADLVTIPFLIAFLLIFELHEAVFMLIFFLSIIFLFYMAFKYKIERRVFYEMSGILIALSIIESFSGALLESYSRIIYESAMLSVIYPAILDSLGNYSAIIAAKTSTKLHLGELRRMLDPKIFEDLLPLLSTGIVVSAIIYLIGYQISSILLKKGVKFFPPFIIYYLILLCFVMLLSSILASFFHRLGLDPDNVSIPTITTVSDLIGTAFTVAIAYSMLSA